MAPRKEGLCVTLFPDPTSTLLNVDLKDQTGKSAVISIYSESGQLMAERKVPYIEGNMEL